MNHYPDTRPGDILLVSSSGIFGRAVNAIQSVWSIDSKSEYSHAGIIIDYQGSTFESSWKVVSKNLYKDHGDHKVLIARHCGMDDDIFERGFKGIEHYEGKRYPIHRLFMHIIPPIAKFSAGPAVCSELVAHFLYDAGVMPYWMGVNPDSLADMVTHWKGWGVVFEGVLSETTGEKEQ